MHSSPSSRAYALFKDFPTYLINFARRFATGSYPSATTASSDGQLFRDTFGLRQIIIVATPYGKVYTLDSSNGAILWSRVLGLGWAAEVGGQVHPVKLFVVKTVSEGGHPEVALVTQRRADNVSSLSFLSVHIPFTVVVDLM